MRLYGEPSEPQQVGSRPITELFVRCSLRVRHLGEPGWAASDNCGKHADSAVDMGGGNYHWRCMEHRGVVAIDGDHDGVIITHVITRPSS